MKGYIIDCDYVIRVADYHRITPLILWSSGEDEQIRNRDVPRRPKKRNVN